MPVSDAQKTLEHLLSAYREGDVGGFNAFFARTQRVVYSYLHQRLRNPSDADDVFQDVYFRVHRYVASYDGSRDAKVWLMSIARHALFDHVKRNRRNPDSNQEMVERLAAPGNHAEAAEMRDLLAAAFTEMTPDEIALVVDRLFHDESYESIASARGWSVDATRQRLSRLLRRVKSAINDR